MIGVSVEWKGLDEIQRAFKALPIELEKRAVRLGLRYGAETYRDGMSRRAPERTGALAAGIGYRVVVSPTRGAVAQIGPQSLVFYGSFQELGTRFQAPHPFMRNTMIDDGPMAISAFVHGVRAIFDRLLSGIGIR